MATVTPLETMNSTMESIAVPIRDAFMTNIEADTYPHHSL